MWGGELELELEFALGIWVGNAAIGFIDNSYGLKVAGIPTAVVAGAASVEICLSHSSNSRD